MNALTKNQIETLCNRCTFRAIAAVDRHGVIGYNNDIIFKNPNDLSFFKQKTLKRPIVMGYKTFKSIGCHPLKYRKNIVLTSNPERAMREYLQMTHTRDDLFNDPKFISNPEDIAQIAEEYGNTNVWVVGGNSMYELFMPIIHTWVLSEYVFDVVENGVEYELLEEGFDPSKIVKLSMYRDISSRCSALLEALENFPLKDNRVIQYKIRAYRGNV